MNAQSKVKQGKTRTVSAAEANRQFSKLLREAQDGVTVTITSRGKPVAVLSAPDRESVAAEEAEKDRRWSEYIAELKTRPALNLPRFKREELYD